MKKIIAQYKSRCSKSDTNFITHTAIILAFAEFWYHLPWSINTTSFQIAWRDWNIEDFHSFEKNLVQQQVIVNLTVQIV